MLIFAIDDEKTVLKETKEIIAKATGGRISGSSPTGEIALALWEQISGSKAEANRIRVLISDLKSTLKEIGMDSLLIRERRNIGIRREGLDCDYYRMLEGDMALVQEEKICYDK